MDDSTQQNNNSQQAANGSSDDQVTLVPVADNAQHTREQVLLEQRDEDAATQPSSTTVSQDDRIKQLNIAQSQAKPAQSYHPVSSLHKEQAPVRANETMRSSEPGESQPEISAELKEIGIEESQDEEQLKLSAEQELAGLEPAKESVPMNSHITANMKFPQQPFTANEADDIIKTTSPDESKHWLAVLVLSILHKLHIKELRKKEESKLSLVEKAA